VHHYVCVSLTHGERRDALADMFSRHDWEVESAKMGAIYEGTYLTIAAFLASRDEDSFLCPCPERNEHKSEPLHFEFCRQLFRGIRMRRPHDLRDRASADPLSSHGWTLQERLLATRLFSFSSGVTFECPQTNFCECGEGLYPNPFSTNLLNHRFVDKEQFLKLLDTSPPDPTALLLVWQ
jgi:hypothetical protein